MTRNTRTILMATTLLAGFAICSFDAAQAGPNSFGGGGGSFSSMRTDFGRIGNSSSAGRALISESRVIPLDVKKTTKKDDSKKSAAKKGGIGVSAVLNPKGTGGGKGKEDVGSGPELHIAGGLIEAFRLTNGNLADLKQFGEMAEWLKSGLLVVVNPAIPSQDDGAFNPEFPGGSDGKIEQAKAGSGWDPFGIPRPTARFGAKTGQVSEGGPSATDNTRAMSHWWFGQAKDESTQATARASNDLAYDWMPPKPKDEPTASFEVFAAYDKASDPKPEPVAIAKDPNETWYQASGPKEGDEVATPRDDGGRYTGPVICPLGGCRDQDSDNGRPRTMPREESSSTTTASRASPSWVTDPSEEGYTGGGGNGNGRTGYTPQDEEGGGIGGPGNPALQNLNTAL